MQNGAGKDEAEDIFQYYEEFELDPKGNDQLFKSIK